MDSNYKFYETQSNGTPLKLEELIVLYPFAYEYIGDKIVHRNITCSCQCNYTDVDIPENKYYLDIETCAVYRLEGDPSYFRMVIDPNTHEPYFVSSSFIGKCEEINWREIYLQECGKGPKKHRENSIKNAYRLLKEIENN